MSIYFGDSTGKARLAHKPYVGVGGVAKKISKIYVGVDGIFGTVDAKLCWDNKIPKPTLNVDSGMATITFTDTSKRANGYRITIEDAPPLIGGHPSGTYPKHKVYDRTMTPGSTVTLNLITVQDYPDMVVGYGYGTLVSVCLIDTTGYFESFDSDKELFQIHTYRTKTFRFKEILKKPGKEYNLFAMGSYSVDGILNEQYNFTVNDEGVWYGSNKAYDFNTDTWLQPRSVRVEDTWCVPEDFANWLQGNTS